MVFLMVLTITHTQCILKIYTQDGKEYRLTTDNKETRDEWKVAIEEAMTKLVHILGQYEV